MGLNEEGDLQEVASRPGRKHGGVDRDVTLQDPSEGLDLKGRGLAEVLPTPQSDQP